MIDSETVRKLRQLDLSEFVDTLEMQEMDQDTRHLPFDERLQLSIDYLYQEKYNKRVSGLIKRSKFRIQDADVASIHYEKREIDRQTLQELATDYCGTIAPSGRILAPLKAEKKPVSAEAAPLIFIKGNRKNQRKYGFKP